MQVNQDIEARGNDESDLYSLVRIGNMPRSTPFYNIIELFIDGLKIKPFPYIQKFDFENSNRHMRNFSASSAETQTSPKKQLTITF